MEELLTAFLNHYSYIEVYGLTVLYFIVLYFIVGSLFEKACQALQKRGLAEQIHQGKLPTGQTYNDIKNSLVAIVVFGFSSWPLLYLYRAGHFHFETNTVWHVLLGLIALNVWNEIHFYLVHRLMHTRFFMANVHHVHHRSRVPTVKSVYSFHWFEALLLSTVPLTLGSVWPLAPLAIAIYPLNSLLFNFAGHCNYRLLLFKNTRLDMASRHIQHHRSVHISYGFVSSWLDRLFKTQSPH